MQPSLPVSPPTSAPVSASVGNMPFNLAGFGEALAKLFNAVAPPQEIATSAAIQTTSTATVAPLTAPSEITLPSVATSSADAAPDASIAQSVTIAAAATMALPVPAVVTATDSAPGVPAPTIGATRREPASRATQKPPLEVTDPASIAAQPSPVANVPIVSAPACALPPETTSHDIARDLPKPAASIAVTTPLEAQLFAAAHPPEPLAAEPPVQPLIQKAAAPPQAIADNGDPPISAPGMVSSQLIAVPSTPSLPAIANPAPAEAAIAPRHTTPVAQISPALISLARSSDGTQHLTVRLDPPDLGRVQIRIDRSPDAQAHVVITVERPETLTLLLRDQPQLQHALDQAGVPATGRSVTFHIAVLEPAARAETPMPAPPAGGASPGMGGDFPHGASRHDGRSEQPSDFVAHGGGSDAPDVSSIAPATWLRGGLDITA